MKTLKILMIMLSMAVPAILAQESSSTSEGWDRVWKMKPGYFRVLKDGHVGLIDTSGKVIIPCKYDQIFDLNDKMYVKVLKDLRMGLYHVDRGLVCPAEYDMIWDFEDGLAKVSKNRKLGFINEYGNIVVPPIYDFIGEFDNGLALASLGNEDVYLDKNGKIINPDSEQEESIWENGVEAVERDSSRTDKNYNKPAVKIGPEMVENDKDEDTKHYRYSWSYRRSGFEPHLAAFTLGINGYLDSKWSEDLPEEYSFMNRVHEKSVEVGIYPFQQGMRLIGRNFGLSTALGVKFNNYRFDLSNITEVDEGSRAWFPQLSDEARIRKSKLTNITLAVPVALELQIPNNYDKFYISAGVEGSIRLHSYTKVVFKEDRDKEKQRKTDDFGLRGFRYDCFVRAGFKDFGIYASYSPQSLFKEGKGPELYPYTIGVTFNLD